MLTLTTNTFDFITNEPEGIIYFTVDFTIDDNEFTACYVGDFSYTVDYDYDGSYDVTKYYYYLYYRGSDGMHGEHILSESEQTELNKQVLNQFTDNDFIYKNPTL